MIGVRNYIHDDYNVLTAWWDQWGMPYIPKSILSTRGYMVENVAVGFLYTTDSKMGIIENFLTNKNTPKKIKSQAIDLIIMTMLDIAHQLGLEVLVTASDVPSILERGQKFNFILDDRKCTMMSRRL